MEIILYFQKIQILFQNSPVATLNSGNYPTGTFPTVMFYLFRKNKHFQLKSPSECITLYLEVAFEDETYKISG